MPSLFCLRMRRAHGRRKSYPFLASKEGSSLRRNRSKKNLLVLFLGQKDVQQNLIPFRSALSYARHIDGRFIHNRTFGLAYPASNAEVINNDRSGRSLHASIRKLHIGLDQLYGFWRGGAVFLTDNAGRPYGIGNASVFINPGCSDDHLRLLGHSELLDGSCGTDL